MLTSANWAEALAPGIREWFFVGAAQRPSFIGNLFNVQTSSAAYEEFMSYGAISPDAWDEYEKSGRQPEVDFDKGYKTTLTHKEYTLKTRIQRKLVADNRYPQIMQLANQLGDSATQKRERDAAGVFINCAVATVLGGDGVPLCDNSHPLSPTKSGTVQDNLDSLALSVDNLETVRQKMLAVKDDIGNLAGVQPDLLVYAGGLENTAKTIIDSVGKVGSADNDINPLAGSLRRLALPMLTSDTQWFLVDSIKMKQSLYWFDHDPVDVHRDIKRDETLDSIFIAYMRYAYGWTDWRFINRGNS